MWFKDLFEAYDDTYDMQQKILSINSQLSYVKDTVADNNVPDSILVPSDVQALKDISYIKIMKYPNTLTSDLYSRLMEQCISFINDYPNMDDEKFVDELVNINQYTQNF